MAGCSQHGSKKEREEWTGNGFVGIELNSSLIAKLICAKSRELKTSRRDQKSKQMRERMDDGRGDQKQRTRRRNNSSTAKRRNDVEFTPHSASCWDVGTVAV
jgi:hypothetical protein